MEQSYKSENPHNLLAKDRHLLEQPLQNIRKLPNALIRAWLLEFKTATTDRDKVFNAETAKSSAVLRSFLTQHDNPTRPSSQTKQRTIRNITIHPRILPIPHFHTSTNPIPQKPPHSKNGRPLKRKPTSVSTPNQPSRKRSTYNTNKYLRTPPIPSHHTLLCPHASITRSANLNNIPMRNPSSNIGMYVTDIEVMNDPSQALPIQPFTWNTNGTKHSLMQGSWRPP